MPFIAVPIDLPPQVVELRHGDIDADGEPELVAVERRSRGTHPDTMTVTAYDLDERANVLQTWSTPLQNRPLIIDIEAGLWAVGRTGLVQITAEGVTTVAQTHTGLSGLGKTTPVFGDVFFDIEDDGIAEGVVIAGRQLNIVGTDGQNRASVPVPTRGELKVGKRRGVNITSSSVTPTWAIDDFDGDGFKDLLLPDGTNMVVHTMDENGIAATNTIELPIDIAPKEREGARKDGQTERRVVSVWMEDMDGDQKTDFAAQLWVTKGSWMGAEGELVFARGTGGGFAPPQRMTSDNAVLLVRLIDLNGNGKKEIASAEIDFSVGNLTRAMLTQKIKVDVLHRRMENGRYLSPQPLHSVVIPVGNDRDPPVELQQDITGDGIPDLVTAEEGKSIQVFEGTDNGFGKAPFASIDVRFEAGEDRLWVGDILGDARAEIVVWRLRQPNATIFYLQQ